MNVKTKSRNFTFLLYPDSLPEGWKDSLEMIGVPIAISPLHDKDLSPVEGQIYKKAHYHVVYIANNPVTADSVRVKIQNALGKESVALVKTVASSLENMYLYLTHESKDAKAKNKHVYPKKEIQLLNNFDIDRYVVIDAETKDEILNTVCEIIVDNQLKNIIQLMKFINANGSEYDLDAKKVNHVIRAYTGLVRLYFDGVYQEDINVKTANEYRKNFGI